jgi:hypothetical protein
VLPSGDEPVSAASTLVLPSGDEPVSAASTLVLPSGDEPVSAASALVLPSGDEPVSADAPSMHASCAPPSSCEPFACEPFGGDEPSTHVPSRRGESASNVELPGGEQSPTVASTMRGVSHELSSDSSGEEPASGDNASMRALPNGGELATQVSQVSLGGDDPSGGDERTTSGNEPSSGDEPSTHGNEPCCSAGDGGNEPSSGDESFTSCGESSSNVELPRLEPGVPSMRRPCCAAEPSRGEQQSAVASKMRRTRGASSAPMLPSVLTQLPATREPSSSTV